MLGRAAIPLLRAAGHEVEAPGRTELDLYDPAAVARAVAGANAVLHLATRIPPLDRVEDREAWRENDRLRTEASRLLVDAALAGGSDVYVQAAITFVLPADRPVDEETPVGEVPDILRSVLDAEAETARFAAAGRRGVVLRFGYLDGPGTGNEEPNPMFGSTLHTEDAGHALVAALPLPSGIYNVCRDGGHVSCERFKRATGWAARS